MKIRNGFVSNSSSSSFMIILDDEPKSSDDIMKALFGGKEGTIQPYGYGIAHSEISEIVYNDILKSGKVEKKDVVEFISSLVYDDIFEAEYHTQMMCLRYPQIVTDSGFMTLELKNAENKQKTEFSEFCKKYNMRNIYSDCDQNGDKLSEEILTEASKLKILHGMNRNEIVIKRNDYIQKFSEARAEEFINDNKDKHIYLLEYSDDTQHGSVLEHGNIFRAIKHITVSNH